MNPEYIAFVLVPVFFLLGLLGVLVCHILKRKGYRCTTEAEDEEEAARVAEAEKKDLEMCTGERFNIFSFRGSYVNRDLKLNGSRSSVH